jgi:hypothetical protein
MDIIKARRFLLKIQAMLEHDTARDLSRLEKDLLKSYIIQLYDSMTDEAEFGEETTQPRIPVSKSTPVVSIEKTDIPAIHPKEPPTLESPKAPPTEFTPPKPVEVPLEISFHKKETTVTEPRSEYKPKEVVHTSTTTVSHKVSGNAKMLEELFDLSKSEEVSGRFSHIPIASIESAMGLNERIFTLNELFGGDKSLFDETCRELNSLNSFSEAKSLLMKGAAAQFHWGEAERVKMAEQFIRIVARRYPKS